MKKPASSNRCSRCETMLVDLEECERQDSKVHKRACPRCERLTLVDVVRQLYRRGGQGDKAR